MATATKAEVATPTKVDTKVSHAGKPAESVSAWLTAKQLAEVKRLSDEMSGDKPVIVDFKAVVESASKSGKVTGTRRGIAFAACEMRKSAGVALDSKKIGDSNSFSKGAVELQRAADWLPA